MQTSSIPGLIIRIWLSYNFFNRAYVLKMISVEGLVIPNKALTNLEILDAVENSKYLDFVACSYAITYR